jgi:hypothetical protein
MRGSGNYKATKRAKLNELQEKQPFKGVSPSSFTGKLRQHGRQRGGNSQAKAGLLENKKGRATRTGEIKYAQLSKVTNQQRASLVRTIACG